MASVVAPLDLYIRPMREADVDRVLQVERSAYEFPWTKKIFIDCLRAQYRCFVGVHRGELVAHAVMSAVLDEAHLLNICVAQHWQRQGFGVQLLDAVSREAVGAGAESMYLEVRPSNTAALKLYDGMGFESIGRRRDYYPSPQGREDAVVLMRNLSLYEV